MENAFRDIWPEGLVPSLWNDNLLKNELAPDVPFSGLTFNWDFVFAFIAGSIIIMVFAWRRFREHSYDQKSLDYRVMQHLAPTDLRARSPMGRAYFVYVSCILFVYLSLTFFGELIFHLLNMSPVAGIQMDTSNIDLDNPNWPLTLAFGFAGFLPLFRILQVPEEWLRIATHQLVGIPTRIEAHTRNFIARLQSGGYYDKTPMLRRETKDGAEPVPEEVPAWIHTHFGVTEDPIKFYNRRDEIELMVSWLKEERIGNWPETGIRQKLAPLQEELMAEAVSLLGEFESLIVQDYEKPSRESIARHKSKDTDALAAHQQMLRKKFREATEKMEKLRDELASLFTVYAERDGDFDAVLNPDLRRLLSETFPELHAAPGLERNLAFSVFLLIGVAYAVFIWQHMHPTLTWKPPSPPLIFWTATVETLKTASLFLFPITAVMYWRFFLVDHQVHRGTSALLSPRQRWTNMVPLRLSYRILSQVIRIICIAGVIALLGLVGTAFLSSVVISEDKRELFFNFLRQPVPFVLYYASYAPIGVVQALFAVFVVEWARSPKPTRSGAIITVAVINALVTVALYYGITAAWSLSWDAAQGKYATYSCTQSDMVYGEYYLFDFFQRSAETGKGFTSCFYEYFGLDYLVYTLLPFLVVCFAWARAHRTKETASERKTTGPDAALAAKAAAAAALALSLASLAPAPAEAETHDREQRIDILLGFREDAEPFSYRMESGDDDPQYIGYIADLCHYIFNSSKYVVHQTRITADTRITRLKAQPPAGAPPKRFDPETDDPDTAGVDVICDPITVRYQRPAGLEERDYNGIFSPIVFTSGVSYLERDGSGSALGPTYLGFIKDTTSEEIVRQACDIDLFDVQNRSEPKLDAEGNPIDPCAGISDSDPANPVADCESRSEKSFDPLEPDDPHYVFCAMSLHNDAISWFCSEREGRPHRIYFGDRDIIVAKLRAWRRSGRPCPGNEIRVKDKAYSYEPYALLVSKNDPDLLQHVQQRIYEFFSHSTKAKGLFETYFPGQRFSRPLAYLFLLNAVDQEYHYSSPDRFLSSQGQATAPIKGKPAEDAEEIAKQ